MVEEVSLISHQVIVSFQHAMFGHCFPKLRLISMYHQGDDYTVNFYVTDELSDDDKESISLFQTYFGVGIPEGDTQANTIRIIIVPPASPITYEGECLFARKEERPLIIKKQDHVLMQHKDRRCKILYAMQRAVINHISPQVRKIGVSFDQDSVIIIAIVDGALSEENTMALHQIQNDFMIQMPSSELKDCFVKIIRVDFPQRTDGMFQKLIYLRKEYSDLNPSQIYDVYSNL